MFGASFSVKNRLIVSFGGAALFTVVASALGIFTFVQSRAALYHVTQSRFPIVTTAHQIARQTEALAATATNLLSAKVPTQRDTAANRISDQMNWLGELVVRLRTSGVAALADIERKKGLLLESFRTLNRMVQVRIEAQNERRRWVRFLGAARRILETTVGRLRERGMATSAALDTVRDRVAATANLLLAAANAPNPHGLKKYKMEFQILSRRALESIRALPDPAATAVGDSYEKLGRLGFGQPNLFELRERELNAAGRAERMVNAYDQNAKALVIAANALIDTTQAEIDAATQASRANLLMYGIILVIFAISCVTGAIALAVYMGRNIGGRLSALQKSMALHASGGTGEIPSGGRDEIGRMAVALKRFIETIGQREDQLRHARDALKQKVVEIARREHDVRLAKEEADISNRAKSEFLANMSHELRTPLNAIIGFSEIITGEVLGTAGNPKYVEYAKDINESGQHLLQLINDILDLSKIEAGKLELHEEFVNLDRVIRGCLTLIEKRAASAGVEVESRILSDLPTFYADERQLKQILLNLLSNAVKFTPSGGVVTLITHADFTRGITLTVVDTGIGISTDDIDNVLSPFVQVDSTLGRKYDGTGLGLPLVAALVEGHGGTLEMESEVGVGTKVTVTFPVERIGGRLPPAAQSRV